DLFHRLRAVEALIAPVIRRDDRAVQRDAAIDAFGLRPHDDVAAQIAAGRRFRACTKVHDSQAGTGADLEPAALNRAQRAFGIEDHHDFGLLYAGLKAERGAAEAVEGRAAPAAAGAREHHAGTAFGAKHERAFDIFRHDQNGARAAHRPA